MTFTQEEKRENYFLSQPHQPFFVLGIFNAIAMMLLFALHYKGILFLQNESLNLHVYSLVFMVFTNVFTGFLFTTYPRFCGGEAISKNYYKNVFFGTALSTLIFISGLFINTLVMIAGMLVLLVSQAFVVLKLHQIYTSSNAQSKEDPYWILIAQYFGLLGHLLFFVSVLGLEVQVIAVKLSFYMFLIFLTLSVAQRMIPFFAHSFEIKDERFMSTVLVLFILKTILGILDSYTYVKVAEIVLDVLLGMYLLGEFLRWKLPLFHSPAILWVLFLGLFWLPTAFFFSALSSILELLLNTSFYFLSVHLIAIGFLTTILIGFGTRVTLGHSGQSPNADALATKIFWFIQVVVLFRVLYSVNVAFGFGLGFLFDLSFSAWLVLFIVWATRYGKVLIFGSKL